MAIVVIYAGLRQQYSEGIKYLEFLGFRRGNNNKNNVFVKKLS